MTTTTLLAVCLKCFLLVHSTLSVAVRNIIPDEVEQLDLSGYMEGSNPAVLFTIPSSCTSCEKYIKLIDDLSNDPLYSGDIFILNSSQTPWFETLDPPRIVFLNAERKLAYLGPLHRTHFMNAAHEFAIGVQGARLDDWNFEHDTQASTGSTTGDWLVIFDQMNIPNMQVYDSLTLSLRARHINLGVLDPSKSISTAKRFNIMNNPDGIISAILIKKAYVYRFQGELHRTDFEKILDFALTKYEEHSKSMVPRPRMTFDIVVDWLVDIAVNKEALYGRHIVLLFGVFALFTLLTVTGLLLAIGFWMAGSFHHDRDSTDASESTGPRVGPHEAGDDGKHRPTVKPKSE